MYREREDLEISHQLRQIPENQIPESRAITVPRRNEPSIVDAAKSAPAKPRRAARKARARRIGRGGRHCGRQLVWRGVVDNRPFHGFDR